MFLSSGDASDSICPKGWGIGGLYGDRSYRKLIRDAYGANKGNIIINLKYQEFSETIGSEKIAILQPLSIVYSEYYGYTYGSIPYGRNIEAYIIETSQESQKLNTNLVIMKIVLALGYGTNKNADGNSLRCVAKSLIYLCFVGTFLGALVFLLFPLNFLPVMLLTLSAPKGGE